MQDADAEADQRLACRTYDGKAGEKASNPAGPIVASLYRDYPARAMTLIRVKVRTSGKAKRMWGTIGHADDAEAAAKSSRLAGIDRTVLLSDEGV